MISGGRPRSARPGTSRRPSSRGAASSRRSGPPPPRAAGARARGRSRFSRSSAGSWSWTSGPVFLGPPRLVSFSHSGPAAGVRVADQLDVAGAEVFAPTRHHAHRPFPVPDGDVELLIREIWDDVDVDPLPRDPQSPARGVARSAPGAPPVIEDVHDDGIGAEGQPGAVGPDQRPLAPPVDRPVATAQPVEHEVAP